jgi:disulfide bond formation protein DsbB
MNRQRLNRYLIFILFTILVALTSAFVVEYGLGHKPCNLCVYERVPYIVSIFLILEILFIKKHLKTILLLLSLIFILSSGLAFYHFGIEQGFFKESFVCENKNLSGEISKEQLIEELKQSAISCKDVSFRVLGLSLAAINTIFSLTLSVILIKLYINYEKN